MKKITKVSSSQSEVRRRFEQYVADNKPRNWEDLGQEEDLKRAVRECILIKEQGGCSAYTERLLRLDEKMKVHIDHFRKRALFRTEIFSWDNLFVDEYTRDYGAVYKDTRVHLEDYDVVINPAEDDPSLFFEYQAGGSIFPKEGLDASLRQKAEKTIELFNLNHGSLVQQRRRIIEAICDIRGGCGGDNEDVDIRDALRDYGFPSVVEAFSSASFSARNAEERDG